VTEERKHRAEDNEPVGRCPSATVPVPERRAWGEGLPRTARRAGAWLARADNALFVILLAALMFLSARQQGFFLSSPADELLAVGQRMRAPAFALPALDGPTVGLEDSRGEVVLVNFWATWCPPCRAEMASMEELYRAYRDRGLTILAISTDAGGAQVVEPFVRARGLTFPILLDPPGAVANRYAVRGLPTSYLVDRDGTIVSREVGARDWAGASARRLVEKVLLGPAASATTAGAGAGR